MSFSSKLANTRLSSKFSIGERSVVLTILSRSILKISFHFSFPTLSLNKFGTELFKGFSVEFGLKNVLDPARLLGLTYVLLKFS